MIIDQTQRQIQLYTGLLEGKQQELDEANKLIEKQRSKIRELLEEVKYLETKLVDKAMG